MGNPLRMHEDIQNIVQFTSQGWGKNQQLQQQLQL
jgi:hypothetical protein